MSAMAALPAPDTQGAGPQPAGTGPGGPETSRRVIPPGSRRAGRGARCLAARCGAVGRCYRGAPGGLRHARTPSPAPARGPAASGPPHHRRGLLGVPLAGTSGRRRHPGLIPSHASAVCPQELAERGWPTSFLAARLGTSTQTLAAIRARKRPRIALRLDRAIRNCHGELTTATPCRVRHRGTPRPQGLMRQHASVPGTSFTPAELRGTVNRPALFRNRW